MASEKARIELAQFAARCKWAVISHGEKRAFSLTNVENFDTLESNSYITVSKAKTVQMKPGSQQQFSLIGAPEDVSHDILALKPLPKEDWASWDVISPPKPTGETYWFDYHFTVDHLLVQIGRPVTFNIQVEWRAVGEDFNVKAVTYEIDASEILDSAQSWFQNLLLPRNLLTDPLVVSSGLYGIIKKGLKGKKIRIRTWFNGEIPAEMQLLTLITVSTTVLFSSITLRVASVRSVTPFLDSICEAKARLRSPLP